jgi:glycosyltransferase involved in cell wall biosynthesis
MNSQPLLSIVIATKNRVTYLRHCLRSLKHIPSPEVEIIICDNSDRDNGEVITLEALDSRFKYFYSNIPIPATDNFEKGIGLASGRYITMIGDDDSTSSKIWQIPKWMEENDVVAVLPEFAVYYWPDITFKYYGDRFASTLTIPKYSGAIVEKNAKDELLRCLKYGCTDLLELPRLYYGIIKKEILEAVKVKAGRYIPGPSPDIANAVSVAFFTSKYIKTDIPVFIAGNSSKSAAGMGANKKHIGSIEGVGWLPKDTASKWSTMIPKFWSGPTIWAESSIKALQAVEGSDLLDKFNGSYLHARCLVFHLEYWRLIKDSFIRYVRESKTSKASATFFLVVYYVKTWFIRFTVLLKKLPLLLGASNDSTGIVHSQIPNVEEAMKILDEKLDIDCFLKQKIR